MFKETANVRYFDSNINPEEEVLREIVDKVGLAAIS